MPDSPVVLLYDAAGLPVSNTYAPCTSRPGQALYSSGGSAAQGGFVQLGSDYAASPKAQVPKVDANGYQYVTPLDAILAGQAVASASAVVGNVPLALQGLVPTALQMDALGQVAVAPLAQATFSVYASAVALANGKSLLALMNKSTSSVIRLLAVYAQNSGTSPSGTTTYNIFAEQLHFVTGLTGGTAVTPLSWDSADTLPTGITAATAGTVSGEVAPAIRRWITSSYPLAPGTTAAEDTTADQQGREPWLSRLDASAKSVTVRPNQGVHVKAASTVSNGYQDVTLVFTVASA